MSASIDSVVREGASAQCARCLQAHWCSIYEGIPSVRTVHSLDLDVTEGCNLACIYCFKWQKKAVHMDEPTAKAAIDWLLEASGRGRDLKINLMGGEPLLRHSNPVAERARNGALLRYHVEPELDHLIHLMRHAYSHREEGRRLGQAAARVARRDWTWRHAAEKLASLFALQPSESSLRPIPLVPSRTGDGGENPMPLRGSMNERSDARPKPS